MAEPMKDFLLAIRQKDAAKVQELLDKGLSPNKPSWDFYGRPAIHEATYRGNVDIVKMLLNAGADPNAKNNLMETAMHNAFHPRAFSKEIVCMLLEKGAGVNQRGPLNRQTPMHLVTSLIACKLSSAYQSDVLEVLDMMCKKADPTIRNSSGETAMHKLVSGTPDCCEALQILINNGYEMNAQNDRGETSLMCAIDNGNVDLARLLIESGACVNIKDKHFQTALHHSAQKDLPSIVEPLLGVQCDINAADLNGDTALHISCSKGLKKMVRALISSPHVDINIQNIRGSTPLLTAVESGFTPVVTKLLEVHCDAECEKGLLRALDLAEEDTYLRSYHPEIIWLLKDALKEKRDLWDEGETSL